jgi:hypothetical protein
VSLERRSDGVEPIRGLSGPEEIRRVARSSLLAVGTLACPGCDAPVAPGARPLAPGDALGCPFCGHAGAVRDFLSLTVPSRPARVEVRVLAPSLRRRSRAQA